MGLQRLHCGASIDMETTHQPQPLVLMLVQSAQKDHGSRGLPRSDRLLDQLLLVSGQHHSAFDSIQNALGGGLIHFCIWTDVAPRLVRNSSAASL